ncbi:glutathione S-transferase N-terminal domain-containing protein [Desulfovirgula thermocuniculi]|uniref:glutathione S-transferase N-terminal domain-containing protein n=1 Tax=Desulfovirgula thermocuniculi TaxID=348842 RepID=UPI000426991C|nr:glutathione S-transferase N-terminal domain-containing protein [Desulfovirgula thermocuniculi]
MSHYRWVSCFFFLAAFAWLLAWGRGALVVPGAAAALAGTAFSALCWEELAALVGIGTASASFAAQGFLGRCDGCILAALFFALGGLAAGASVFAREGGSVLKVAVGVSVFLLLVAVAFFVRTELVPVSRETPDIPRAGAEAGPPQSSSGSTAGVEGGASGKALLYFSPFCRSCDEALSAAIRCDPDGERWEPVVVPELAFHAGEEKLTALGYRGKAGVSAASPAGKVPCLVLPDGRILTGAGEVTAWFQKATGKE